MLLHRSRHFYAEWTGPLNDLRPLWIGTNVRFIFPYSRRSFAVRIGSLLLAVGVERT